MIDKGAQNEEWAKKLIDSLVNQGIDYFCCGAGSRSTPLILALASHPKAHYMVHFDERGVGFHALGYSKAKQKPAVIIVTSGTALGNLMPAIMEAHNERIPLVILSADRPPELRDCGANQTCDQVKLFSPFLRFECDLPCPDDQISNRYLASLISHALAMSMGNTPGPIHINCMFREPLFSTFPQPFSFNTHVCFDHPVLHPTSETIENWTQRLSPQKDGVIIVGSSSINLSEIVFPLAKRLKWPIFADILSSLRNAKGTNELIVHFDSILKVKKHLKSMAVIQFGDRIVSKTLMLWLEQQTPEFYLHISSHPMRQDPSHLVTHRIHCSPHIFTRELLSSLPFLKLENSTWLQKWSDWDFQCKQTLKNHFSFQTELSEPSISREIAAFLPEEWSVFFANSMPIRDANQFFDPNTTGTLFGNRGVSGIDGNIATATGLVAATQRPLLALIGDMTFLHDINSLAMIRSLKHPLILCVINNNGGGIFSFLPIAKKKEIFEDFFATAHQMSFSSAAELFDLSYFHPQTLDQFKNLLAELKFLQKSCIIELTTNRAENVRIHEQITDEISTCLNAAYEPLETQITLV